MALPQRHIEILQTLAENPAGLTTAQVAKLASDKPGAEVPNDTGVVSSLVYSLRNSGLLSSHDHAGKRVHKITGKGRDAIDEAMPAFAKAVKEAVQKADNKPAEIDPDYQEIAELINTPASQTILMLDPDDEVDAPFIQIISTLKAALNTPAPAPIRISDKDLKIDTLNRLGVLLSPDIGHIFNQIINDLKQLESAQ